MKLDNMYIFDSILDLYREMKHIIRCNGYCYFLYDEEDTSRFYIFQEVTDMERWVSKRYYEVATERTGQMGEAIKELIIYEMVDEGEVNEYKNLYKDVKKSMKIDDDLFYRKKMTCVPDFIITFDIS